MDRRYVKELKLEKMGQVGAQFKDLNAAGKSKKGAGDKGESSPQKKPDAKAAKPTEAEKKKKAAQMQKSQRQGRRENQTFEKKMEQAVKPVRDPKAAERARQAQASFMSWLETSIIDQIVTKAVCYGESLQVCRDIQQKFETRPVTKFVYPLLSQF